MKYKLVYTKTAAHDIKKLDPAAKKRIKKKIEGFITKPFFYATKLTHSALGQYRWRVVNYRIIFDTTHHTIIILRIGHRREIYKR